MAEQFEESARGLERGPFEFGLTAGASMNVDVADRDDEFVVTADLPGFDRDEIEVQLVDDTLEVDAERETEAGESEEGRYVRRERSRQALSRSIRLPGAVDESAVTATYSNGVLTVTLPKASPSGGRSVEIE